MRKNSDLLFPQLKRVRQWNEAYCGPAVVEMLLSVYGVTVAQDEVVKMGGVEQKIKTQGMLMTEMGLAVTALNPGYRFWFKREATISELSSLVNTYHLPVGVEWQGLFDDIDDEEAEAAGYVDDDDDAGHYSVITGISTADNWITMADPYMNRGSDRQLTILEFERRWWDINEVIDPYNGKRREMDDYHALFIITGVNEGIGEAYGMEPV